MDCNGSIKAVDGFTLPKLAPPRLGSHTSVRLTMKALGKAMDRALSGCLRRCSPASWFSSRFRSACHLALAPTVGFCVCSAPAVAQEHWATYTNPRFGTAADYPSDLFTVQDPPAENGDGQTFRTADGRAELSIYGTNNLEAERPQAYVARHVNLDDVTFKRVTSDYYVVSGSRGASIYYERCNFPNNDVLYCFYITYPAQEKSAWDATVTRISHSLRGGPN